MKKSDSIIKIAIALSEAQKSIGAAQKDAANPFFKSKYADLGSVMAVCKEPLLANGISVLQMPGHDEHGPILETILLHSSGEYLASEMRIVVSKANDPQAMGSAITYARRYALQSMVFIPSVDDDAEWAERAERNRPPTERESIQAIIDQHLEEAKTASPTRKSQLLGLASELRAKLADMDAVGKQVAAVDIPAPTAETKVSETTVEPPAEKKTRSPKKTEPIAAEFTEADKPWQEIVCHLGDKGGLINGKTLAELFDPKSPKRNVDSIFQWLEKNVNPVIRADTDLMLGANKGYQAWKDAHANPVPKPTQTPATPPAQSEPAKTAEAPVETPTATASESDWREFVITSNNPDYDGKKLGDLPEEKIKKINEEYLSKIDWSKATIAQKKLKAMISLALNLPPAANEEPDHTRKLKAAIQKDGVNRNDFLSECKRAGWIDRGHTKIEDVTEAESNNLLSDWPTVVEQCRQLI